VNAARTSPAAARRDKAAAAVTALTAVRLLPEFIFGCCYSVTASGPVRILLAALLIIAASGVFYASPLRTSRLIWDHREYDPYGRAVSEYHDVHDRRLWRSVPQCSQSADAGGNHRRGSVRTVYGGPVRGECGEAVLARVARAARDTSVIAGVRRPIESLAERCSVAEADGFESVVAMSRNHTAVAAAIDLAESVGRYAHQDFVPLRETFTAAETIEQLRQADLSDKILYLYVVDGDQRLTGVVPVRRLLSAAATQRSTRLCSARRSSYGPTPQ